MIRQDYPGNRGARLVALVSVELTGVGLGLRGAEAGPLSTPVQVENLDLADFAQWMDGKEPPMTQNNGPRHVIRTQTSAPEWDGVQFGESKNSEPRHLHIGFREAVSAGSVLVRAGGQLSVLKSTATFHGNFDNELDWIPFQRLKGTAISRDESGREDYALWVLPPGTSTRATFHAHRWFCRQRLCGLVGRRVCPGGAFWQPCAAGGGLRVSSQ